MAQLAGLRVEGISVGGVETCIEVPDYKLAFDIGRARGSALHLRTVLFTHAHMDHMGGVAMHAATRALRHEPPPTYVVPRTAARDFDRLFEVWRSLDGSLLPHEQVPLAPGEEHQLPNRLIARPFPSPHRAPCQGYALWSVRHKLKAEFEGLGEGEIRRLRVEKGIAVTERREVCELAFTGDTLIDVVEREPTVRKARRLVIEATFLDERVSVEKCRAMGHVHLDEIAERAELFENDALLLTHFSARYSRCEIQRIVETRLPSELLERVALLLNGFE